MKTEVNKTKDDLAKELTGQGVEIGVAKGEFSEKIIADHTTKLIGIDSYKPYPGYRDYTLPQTFANLKNEMLKRVGNNHNFSLLEGWSTQYFQIFADESLDFVYIDGNHSYEYVKSDIEAWWPKVKPGGILCGDDYAGPVRHAYDVIRAVDEFVEKAEIPELIIYKNGEGPAQWLIKKSQ